jgi:hypothetical protein
MLEFKGNSFLYYFCNFLHKLLIIIALAVFLVRLRDGRNILIDKSHLWTEEYGRAVRKFALHFRPETFHLHQSATLTQTKY